MKKRYLVPLVFVTCITGLYLFYAEPPSLPERYVLTADEIVTVDRSNPAVEAILVENGVIRAVGAVDMLTQQSNAKLIELDGTLTPGLIEPHTHPIAAALLGATVDISGFKYSNRKDIMAALKEAVDASAITPWLIAYGWDPVALPDLTTPTREELDAIAPDRPLLILTQMLHDAYVNTAAVEAAGITLDGSLLHETDAVESVVAMIPPASDAVSELLVRRQYARYASAGFTTIGVAGAVGRHRDPIGLLRKLGVDDNSAVRSFVYLLPRHLDAHTIGGDHNFSIKGAKFWMDGSPFTGGAATAEPYAENTFVNDHLGLEAGLVQPVMQPADILIGRIENLHRQGYQIALHVQGERAVDAALDTIAFVQSAHPMPGLHHRLEHNALITKAQMERAAGLGVTLGFFVDHIYYYGHVLPLLFGQERTARYMPVKSALDMGAVVTLHGDHPATPINPLQTMQTAIKRTARITGDVIAPSQAITPLQALETMTINAAVQLGQQDVLGSISVGKQADFTLFSGNPLTSNHSDIRALGTLKSGQPVDSRTVSWLKPGLVWGTLWSVMSQ